MRIPASTPAPDPSQGTSGLGEYFSLAEAVLALRRRVSLIGALALLGGLAGLGLAWFTPSTWTATGLVQIGQVGLAAPLVGNPEAFGVAVEPVGRAAERMRHPAFARRLLRALDLPDGEDTKDREAVLIRRSLEVKIPRNVDLLEVKVSGSSPDSARKAATTVVSLLSGDHAHLAEPTLAKLRSQLAYAEAGLQRALDQQKRLEEALVPAGREVRPSDRFAESVLLSQLLGNLDTEIRSLRQTRLSLEEQLSPRRTFQTALLGEVDVPERRSSPKRALYLLVGAALGLLVGIAWALAASSARR